MKNTLVQLIFTFADVQCLSTLDGEKEINGLSILTSGPSGPLSPFCPLEWNLLPGSPWEWKKDEEKILKNLHWKSRKETHRFSSAAFLPYFSVISFRTLKIGGKKTELIRCKEIHSTLSNISQTKLPSAQDFQSSIPWYDLEDLVGQLGLSFPAGKHLQDLQTKKAQTETHNVKNWLDCAEMLSK